MVGPIIMVIALVVLIPVGFLMSTTIAAWLLGALLKDNAEKTNAGSELIATNR